MRWTDPAVAVLEQLVTEQRTPGAALGVRRSGVEEVRCTGALALDGERSGQPVTPQTPFWIASTTKPVGAVLAQSLLADGLLALDAPVSAWVPELASPRVLLDPAGPLGATEPVARPITVRDVLAGTAGVGIGTECFSDPPPPLFTAMLERGVGPGPFAADLDLDTWVARLAELPLAAQPGTRWRYHTPHDLLSVLLTRAAGRPLPALLAARVLTPLSMRSTGFALPGVSRDDVPDVLTRDHAGAPAVVPTPDPSRGTAFPGLAAGLLSTASDLLRFAAAMADRSDLGAMTTPVLSEAQRTAAEPFLEPGQSWGLGVGVDVAPELAAHQGWHSPGRWGWVGGTGTALFVDPARDLVVVLLTARLTSGPSDTPDPVWRALLDALD